MTTPSAPHHITGARWDARAWTLLIVLCGVILLDALDVSMVAVALPSIGEDLGISTSSLQWVVSGYILGYGGLLLLGGRAADLLGRRRVLLAGLAAFAAASLVGGLVDDSTLLIVSRFLKGAAAAFTAPAALSIITTTFAEGAARNKALGVFTACGASGYSLGLVLGGLLTTVGWRWAFIVPVPLALGLLLVARRVVPSVAVARKPAGYDILGAVTVTASMLALVATIVEAPRIGWGAPRTVGSFIVVALLLTLFVTVEKRTAHPLVRLGILRSGALVRANLGIMSVVGSYFGFQFILTIYLQSLLGWSPLQTALALLPAGLLVAFGAPRMAPLIMRYGTGPAITTSLAAFAAAYLLLLGLDASPTYTLAILPTVLLAGIGFAIGFPALNIQAVAGVADEEQGLASGLLNTSLQLGGAVVTAVVSAVAASSDGVPQLGSLDNGVIVIIASATLGLLVTLSGGLAWWRARLQTAG